MNIGFDLDKVFVDYPPFVPDTIINKLYKKKSNGILLYRIPGKMEQTIRHLSHHPILRPMIKNNLEFLREFSKTNNDLFLISSRFGFLRQRTNDLVKKEGFEKLFKGLYFNYENQQPHFFKDTIIKQLKIEKYIDDDFALVKYLATHNPKVQFYWLNTKEQKKLAKNITAITHLSQVIKTME
jgi:hypothetical protein